MLWNFGYVVGGMIAASGRPGHGNDLRDNLMALHEKGIRAILSLETKALPKALLQESGMKSVSVPIPDFTAPSPAQIERAVAFLEKMLAENKPVLVHCGSGYGRTGTILACYLVSTGMDSDEAIAAVRHKRPGSIETSEQEACIRAYAASLGRG